VANKNYLKLLNKLYFLLNNIFKGLLLVSFFFAYKKKALLQ